MPNDGLLLDKKILDQMIPTPQAVFYQGRDKLHSLLIDTSSSMDCSMGAATLMSPPAYVPTPPVYLLLPPPPPIIQFQPQQTDEDSRLSAASSQFVHQGQNRKLQTVTRVPLNPALLHHK